MENNGCIICGADLIYTEKAEPMQCSICKNVFPSNAKCENGHFICDTCHGKDGFELIEQVCILSKSTNPIELAVFIMGNPKIKMHGPEHHFLVPAVLLTAYYNKTNNNALLHEKLQVAKERASIIPGGFCGFCGNCGAGVGTGIFMSLILDSTPLANQEWKLCNLMTSQSLKQIADNGGPRCCKRDTFLALETAIDFVAEHLNEKLDKPPITCSFFKQNKECRKTECKYFPAPDRQAI